MTNLIDNLNKFLLKKKINYVDNYDIKNNSYSKTGNKVEKLLIPSSRDELSEIIIFLVKNNMEYTIIGETSNILFLDSVIYSIFVSTKYVNKIHFDENTITIDAGRTLPDLVRLLAMKSITGFEGLEGIPGSVGGAIVMNAGAYGYSISDNLTRVHCIDGNGEHKTLDTNDLKFGRRQSFFSNNKGWTILGADFFIKKGKYSDIEKKIETFHIARHTYQEWVYPNLGSVFSVPKSVYDNINTKNIFYPANLKLIQKLFYNKFTRFFNRKKPSSLRLNEIVESYTKLGDYKAFYSHKNLNTLTNKDYKTVDIIRFLHELKNNLKENAFLENELVYKSIRTVVNEDDFSISVNLYKKIKETE
jgi:UDP-N-acetylmuramate dehydrogenase